MLKTNNPPLGIHEEIGNNRRPRSIFGDTFSHLLPKRGKAQRTRPS
jgi:hypothetical protein